MLDGLARILFVQGASTFRCSELSRRRFLKYADAGAFGWRRRSSILSGVGSGRGTQFATSAAAGTETVV
jgi:hypothetical protein